MITILMALQRIPCIQYQVQFGNNKVKGLFNSSNKVNAMNLAYGAKLDLTPQ